MMIETEEVNSNTDSIDCLFIGYGVTFEGTISAKGTASINGSVTGEITVGCLDVGKGGMVKGVIRTKEISVRGEIFEDVLCTNLVFVHSTGLIDGKLQYGELEIQKGGRVAGAMVQKK
jgi:cytoskeletal protein CcmA (bactofilin family)